MSTDSMTPQQQIDLLTGMGVSLDDATRQVLGLTVRDPEVLEQVADLAPTPVQPGGPTYDTTLDPMSPNFDTRTFAPPTVSEAAFDFDKTVAAIVKRAFADKDAALAMCDTIGKDRFDRNKVSKVQAATRNIDRSPYNKALWSECQTIVTTLKRMVREHYTVNGIRGKIREAKRLAPEVKGLDDATMSRLIASEEFLALVKQHTEKESK